MVILSQVKPIKQTRAGLDKKFRKVIETPVGFEFFVAIHDFIEYIEKNPIIMKAVSKQKKGNLEAMLANKYDSLKRIYQGVEDINVKTNADIGHSRYMGIVELGQIQKKVASENNSFWKKREFFKKAAALVHKNLDDYLVSKS